MTFEQKLKEIRKNIGLSQEQFAEKLSVSRSAIAKWESGGGIPDIDNLKMISNMFEISIDELVNDKNISEIPREKKEFFGGTIVECEGKLCNVDLIGWNDGVNDVFIIGEDKDFIFYTRSVEERSVSGMIGKKYITEVKEAKTLTTLQRDIYTIDRNEFCGKHVFIELAHTEGLIKGFFDFRNDDYLDVIIYSFSDSKVNLEFGREIEISAITKIEKI